MTFPPLKSGIHFYPAFSLPPFPHYILRQTIVRKSSRTSSYLSSTVFRIPKLKQIHIWKNSRLFSEGLSGISPSFLHKRMLISLCCLRKAPQTKLCIKQKLIARQFLKSEIQKTGSAGLVPSGHTLKVCWIVGGQCDTS